MTGHSTPDGTDIAILNALQDEIPVVPRPFLHIADKAGISEQETIARIKRLMDCGILRGISPVIESSTCGLNAGTLIAIHVPPERIGEVAAVISSYREVSHNFRRDHHYQIWFTLAGRDPEHIKELISDIRKQTGIGREDLLDLPTVRRLKVDVRFSIPGPKSGGEISGPG